MSIYKSIFSLFILKPKIWLKNLRWLFISLIAGIIFIYPSISFLQARESKIRFQEVSIFNNLSTIKIANERIAREGEDLVARIVHNRRLEYLKDYLKHFTDNFQGSFLFTHGDVNPRLAIQEMGQMYIWILPFLLIGFFFIQTFHLRQL